MAAPETIPDEAWFDEVDLRAALPAVVAGLEARLSSGLPNEGCLRRIGARDPLALTELLLGPRAVARPDWAALRLAVIDLLELGMRPSALYLRMAALAAGAELEVLRLAVRRHRDGPWLRTLSGRVEGPLRGYTQLHAHLDAPELPALCAAWYAAGGRAALIALSSAPPRLAPLVALAEAEDREALVEAAARALSHSPTAPVPAWLAAIWGPELDDLMVDVLAQIDAPPARAALLPWLRGCPRAQAALRAGAPAR
ncbi:MAG: hypothetical protein JNM72_16515 [Deltaproteobacteria bacterium]|nr:hypothetical protein [Deltaproteobacteria bacterium]